MSDQAEVSKTPDEGRPTARIRRPVLLVLLALVLLVEAIGVLSFGVWLLAELVTTVPDSYATAIALIVLVLAAGVWVFAIGVGVFRMRSWTRGAALTWQVLQAIVAICCFQGIFGTVSVGIPLVIFAALGIALLVAPSVVAVTRREV